MMNANPISKAIEIVGLQPLARACGVTSYQAVLKWKKNGLPRTEWTGETRYARIIEQATNGEISAGELLGWSQRKKQERVAA